MRYSLRVILLFQSTFLFSAVDCSSITIIGANYVGLVVAGVLIKCDHKVYCIDKDRDKIKLLKNKQIPIYEPHLQELLFKAPQDSLSFTDSLSEVPPGDLIYICVGTPSSSEGTCDCSAIYEVIDEIVSLKRNPKIICVKSTVPPGTHAKLKQYLMKKGLLSIKLVYNPEFMREGSALEDIMTQNPLVIASDSDKAKDDIEALYAPLRMKDIPVIKTSFETAEIIKYAWNAFSALRVTFVNEVAMLCKSLNANVFTVIQGVAQSERLLPTQVLKPGPGFGGSCFPKDTIAFTKVLEEKGFLSSLVHQAILSNKNHIQAIIRDIIGLLGKEPQQKTVAVLGLSFKANTDDIRNAPSVEIISALKKQGTCIQAYDPQAIPAMKRVFPDLIYCDSVYTAIQHADCILVLTEWEEIKNLDLARASQLCNTKVLFDMRNIYDPSLAKKYGFQLFNLGRQ